MLARSGAMTRFASRTLVIACAVAALVAGAWYAWSTLGRGSSAVGQPAAALVGTTLPDPDGKDQALSQWSGKVLVVNFWATWCTPCVEEMPGFARLQAKWEARGVRFVGLANDDPAKVKAFGEKLAINYPLWTGEAAVMELSRRLGNRVGMLPHTALLSPDGRVIETRIGLYAEDRLDARLAEILP